MNKVERNSSVEMLKLVALFLVVLCHSIPIYTYNGEILPGYIDLNVASSKLDNMILVWFSYFGQFGNAIFIVSSCWFLLNKPYSKVNKILLYIFDTFVVSVIFLLFFLAFNQTVSIKLVIQQLFPTTFGFYWFVTCYLVFYAIHPWLNLVVNKMSKKELFDACIVLFVFYFIISFILGNRLYYNNLIGFVAYYFFTAYAKKYLEGISNNRKLQYCVCIMSFVLWAVMISATNILGLRIGALSTSVRRWETFTNPFIMTFAFSLFFLVVNKPYTSKAVNRLSATSMLVFVISNNQLVCTYIKPIFFEYVYNTFSYEHIVLICILMAMVTFTVSVVLALLYQMTIQKLTKAMSMYVENAVSRVSTKIFTAMEKLN